MASIATPARTPAAASRVAATPAATPSTNSSFTASLADWADDDRIGFLFGTFEEESELTSDVIDWWRTTAEAYCQDNHTFILSAKELADALQAGHAQGLRPQGVPTLFSVLQAKKHVLPLEEAQTAPQSTGSWLFSSFVVTPVTSIVSSVLGSKSGGVPEKQLLVVPRLMETTMAALLAAAAKELPKQSSAVLLKASAKALAVSEDYDTEGVPMTLPALCASDPALAGLCQRDADALIAIAVAQRAASLVDSPHGKALLIGEPPVSADASLTDLRLRMNLTRLAARIARLEAEAAGAKERARERLRAKDKQGAKHYLRRSNQLLKACNSTRETHLNLETLRSKISSMHDSNEIMAAMQSAAAAMKETQQATGMTADLVTEAMEDIADVMEDVDHVNAALAGPLDATDDAALLAELAEIEALSVPEAATATTELPAAPTTPAVTGAGAGAGAGTAPASAPAAASADSLESLHSRLAALKLNPAPQTATPPAAQQAAAPQPLAC